MGMVEPVQKPKVIQSMDDTNGLLAEVQSIVPG